MYTKLTIYNHFLFSKGQIMFWSWKGMGVVKDIISRPFNYTKLHFNYTVFWELMAKVGEGGLPSNHIWLIKRALALSIPNPMSLFRSFYDNRWQSQNFHQMHFGKIRGLEAGFIHSQNTANLKKDTRTSDNQSNEPLRSFYDRPF